MVQASLSAADQPVVRPRAPRRSLTLLVVIAILMAGVIVPAGMQTAGAQDLAGLQRPDDIPATFTTDGATYSFDREIAVNTDDLAPVGTVEASSAGAP
jgi:hypothetical protein